MTPEERKRIVDDAIKNFKPIDADDAQKIIDRFNDVTRQVREIIQPVHEVDEFVRNREAFDGLIKKLYLERLHTWPKDELLFVLITKQTQLVSSQY